MEMTQNQTEYGVRNVISKHKYECNGDVMVVNTARETDFSIKFERGICTSFGTCTLKLNLYVDAICSCKPAEVMLL